MTKKLEQKLPNNVNKAVDYISSSAFIIPIIMFKILIIYYMYTSLASLKGKRFSIGFFKEISLMELLFHCQVRFDIMEYP